MKNQLVESNVKLVYSVIHKHYPTYSKDEDMIAVGYLGLCKAANTWDSEKSEFSTYAYWCIRNEIRKELRNRSKHKDVLSLDFELNDEESGNSSLKDIIVGDSDISYLDLPSIYTRLSPQDKELFELKRAGLSNKEIMAKTGYSSPTIRYHFRKIKKIIKES